MNSQDMGAPPIALSDQPLLFLSICRAAPHLPCIHSILDSARCSHAGGLVSVTLENYMPRCFTASSCKSNVTSIGFRHLAQGGGVGEIVCDSLLDLSEEQIMQFMKADLRQPQEQYAQQQHAQQQHAQQIVEAMSGPRHPGNPEQVRAALVAAMAQAPGEQVRTLLLPQSRAT